MSSAISELSCAYDRATLLRFIDDLLPSVERDTRSIADMSTGFADVVFLGRSSELDLQIFEVKVSGSLDKRVAIATEAFKLMKNTASFRSLVVFYSDATEQWRLSLLTAKPTIDEGKVVTRFSSPKRYSYLLGPGSKLGTPAKQLIAKGRVTDFEDLSQRFAVEVVNDDFYREIAKLYDELVGADQISGVLKYPSERTSKPEFGVRLVGRIIFCWFLREKRSNNGTALIPSQILSREAANDVNYYHATLAPLFFEVLNKRLRNREERFQGADFAAIPYLNGGLFSPDVDDCYKFDKVSQKSSAEKVDVPDEWLCKFFDLLEMYNFTVDENTSFDIDLSIDPEMLGRIFENLLARINPETGETVRKGTGSFYTPREIVEYMVDQSLGNYLIQATNLHPENVSALVNYDLASDDQLTLSAPEKQDVLNALSVAKILDPACGSGAFPMGILQKIVFILQRVDPEAKHWLQKQLVGAGPELRRHLEEEFGNKNFDYLRKLGVIRESIYGVDIQPIATEISRLRCFLTLVVDQSVKDDAPNRGIEPLPNLDFKFVTANSLIKLPSAHTGQIDLFDDQEGIAELKEIRSEYFTAGENERDQIKYRFAQVQKSMFQKMIAKNGFAELTQKLSAWDPFSHKTTDWFDSEWMFGVAHGFDVVIANPPYVDSEHMVSSDPHLRDQLKEIYETARGNWDLFIPFVEMGLKETKYEGVLTYIIPNKLIGAKYASTLRKYLTNQLILEVRDYSRMNVFREAAVYPVTLSIKKAEIGRAISSFMVMTDYDTIKSKNVVPGSDLIGDVLWDKYFLEPASFQLIDRLSKLTNFRSAKVSILGAATVSEAYEIKKYLVDSLEQTDSLKFINTGTIDKYKSLWGLQKTQYIKDGYYFPVISKESLKKISATRCEQALKPKIIIAGMSNELEAYLDTKGEYVPGKSTSFITGAENDLKLYLALLNSKLISFYVSNMYRSLKMAGGYLNISKEILENLPLPMVDEAKKSQVAAMVEEIQVVALMENGTELNQEIDQLVYGLYNLTAEEVLVVESSSN